jgi:RimJ/RimL family protein N-acetyltransferase
MTIAPTLHTERLDLRPWTDADLPMLTELGAMPEVVRYIGEGHPWSPERAAEVAARTLAHWDQHGFGWRVAVLRDTGEAVGFIALNFAGEGTRGLDPGEYEIGWWLAPAVWRRGLGGEGAAAVRDEAFTRVGAPRVIARIQPANVASRRLAEGLGMRVSFETVARADVPVVVYALERPATLATAPA